jgi:hypothetical protein
VKRAQERVRSIAEIERDRARRNRNAAERSIPHERIEMHQHGLYQVPTGGAPGLIDPPGSFAELPEVAEDPFAPGVAPEPSGVPAKVAMATARRPGDWVFPETAQTVHASELIGYRVHALDGYLGRVAAETRRFDGSYLVVATGWALLRRRYMLPVGTLVRIDRHQRAIYVDRPKGQITDAPTVREWESGRAMTVRRQLTA